jgi:hypothetical protein
MQEVAKSLVTLIGSTTGVCRVCTLSQLLDDDGVDTRVADVVGNTPLDAKRSRIKSLVPA